MTDVVPEIQDTVVADKELEEPKVDEIESKEVELIENGATKEEDEKIKNEDATADKSVENGSVKENGVSEAAVETIETKDDEVCAVKRKSEVGLEPEEAAVESLEKKQKIEDSEEPEMAPNGVC